MAVPYLACMALAAAAYHLPPRVLPSIQAVEGGRPGIAHPDADGSVDLGVMQVNTRWLSPLARLSGLPVPEVRARLLWQPCFGIAAAAAILRGHLDGEHGDLMRAVGDYHSRTTPLNLDYQARVLRAATRLFVSRPP